MYQAFKQPHQTTQKNRSRYQTYRKSILSASILLGFGSAVASAMFLTACTSNRMVVNNPLPPIAPISNENQRYYPDVNTGVQAGNYPSVNPYPANNPSNPSAGVQNNASGINNNNAINANSVYYPPVVQNNPNSVPSYQGNPMQGQANYANFEAWKADFLRRNANSPYANTLSHLLSRASLSSRVISDDRQQAEFDKLPWSYLDGAISQQNVNLGRNKLNSQKSLLSRLEKQYGVPAEIVTAIWGRESSYGNYMGKSDLPSSLATLAYEGRRRELFEKQLVALANLVQSGNVANNPLQGSWAGGMGHTQFIPETWLIHGVDGNGDRRRNPWDISDALSSTANYLNRSGWLSGVRPIYEVRLPSNFNYALINNKLSTKDWLNKGVTSVGNVNLPNLSMQLWLPAGKNGPALLLSPNFEVIKVYNNSSNYALSVSLLGQMIRGQGGLQASWPRHEKPLSRSQILNLQRNLTQMGYNTQGIDGVIGTNTRTAFQSWQAVNGQTPDGFITQNSAAALIR